MRSKPVILWRYETSMNHYLLIARMNNDYKIISTSDFTKPF